MAYTVQPPAHTTIIRPRPHEQAAIGAVLLILIILMILLLFIIITDTDTDTNVHTDYNNNSHRHNNGAANGARKLKVPRTQRCFCGGRTGLGRAGFQR